MKLKKGDKKTLFKRNSFKTKIVQFGEGNFLRAFIGHAVDEINAISDLKLGIAVVQPIANGFVEKLEQQGGAYTLFLNGIVDGRDIEEKKLIQNIVSTHNPYKDFNDFLTLAKNPDVEYIISNTTEAGIVFDNNDLFEDKPQKNFPAKLTRFLLERFTHFKGDANKGFHFLPCELINHNADQLRNCILKYTALWGLSSNFRDWIEQHNIFHNTLVDRIVPGYPKENSDIYKNQIPYIDEFMVTAEPFYLWVVEDDSSLAKKLPFDQIDLNIKLVTDMQPYRTRKVRILNGAHTTLVPLSILYGHQTVSDIFSDDFTFDFLVNAVLNEIVPTLTKTNEELNTFANQVFDRFKNPYIKHYLSSIALNSISKFKVRVLPSLLEYQKQYGRLPIYLTFAMACLLRFYKGFKNGEKLPIKDDSEVVQFIQTAWEEKDINQFLEYVLGNDLLWGIDLSVNKTLLSQLCNALKYIEAYELADAFLTYKLKFE